MSRDRNLLLSTLYITHFTIIYSKLPNGLTKDIIRRLLSSLVNETKSPTFLVAHAILIILHHELELQSEIEGGYDGIVINDNYGTPYCYFRRGDREAEKFWRAIVSKCKRSKSNNRYKIQLSVLLSIVSSLNSFDHDCIPEHVIFDRSGTD